MRALLLAVMVVGCGGGSSGPPISLGPGFQPQPTTQPGVAGGPIDGTTVNAACLGSIPPTPQHSVTVTAPIPNLRILVNSRGADTTLIVQLPDGSYRCNDDSDGLNPMVQGPVAVGTLNVYVGAYSAGEDGIPYTIGFTENVAMLPSQVP
jgi:hypothetical protein